MFDEAQTGFIAGKIGIACHKEKDERAGAQLRGEGSRQTVVLQIQVLQTQAGVHGTRHGPSEYIAI